MGILQQISDRDKPGFAVLVDPDKTDEAGLRKLAQYAGKNHVDFFFVGGSHITGGDLKATIRILKQETSIPVLLFPGSVLQVEPSADAMLFLSLISGRNPEYLIGQHIIAAPYIEKSGLETIPTGYIIVESGKSTTVSYISNTNPIPADKPDIAASTALAGEMLGLKVIYADAGSGAQNSISNEMIRSIKSKIHIPLIVGGGIKDKTTAKEKFQAGADIIVIGNAIEDDPGLIHEISTNF